MREKVLRVQFLPRLISLPPVVLFELNGNFQLLGLGLLKACILWALLEEVTVFGSKK